MNLRDLYSLNLKVIAIIQASTPVTAMNALVTHLQQMQSSPTPELRQSIRDDLVLLASLNAEIENQLDVVPHIDFLQKNTNLLKVVGVSAANSITEMANSDPYFSAPEISSQAAAVDAFIGTLSQANSALDNYNVKARKDVPLVSFELGGQIDTKTGTSLGKRLVEIEDIIHAFARLAGDPDAFGKPEIFSMSKSSPTLVDFAPLIHSTEIHLYLLAKGITWVMDRIEQSQKIVIQGHDLRAKKMVNENIVAGFKELEAEPLSDKSIKEFIEEEIKKDPRAILEDAAGAESEVDKALFQAMKKLIGLITKGAKAAVHLPPPTEYVKDDPEVVDDTTELAKRAANHKKTIGIQAQQLKLIGAGSEDTPVEPEESK